MKIALKETGSWTFTTLGPYEDSFTHHKRLACSYTTWVSLFQFNKGERKIVISLCLASSRKDTEVSDSKMESVESRPLHLGGILSL